jgi:hypothetical protein
MAPSAGEPFATTLPEFAARIRDDHAKYGKLIKSIGVSWNWRTRAARLRAVAYDGG